MGLFSSKVKSSYDANTYNQELESYTKTFQGFAPWSFASLDPTAALAAMGGGTSIDGKDLGTQFKEGLKGLSKEEQAQAQAGQDALARIKARQESGQFLTPQETQFINQQLDKAFEYAHKTGYEDW